MFKIINLSLSFEPPFNELTNHLHRKITLDKEITLRELFEYLSNEYGEKFYELLWDKNNTDEFSSFLSVIINGRSYRGDKFLETVLKNGDDITFLYIFFGG